MSFDRTLDGTALLALELVCQVRHSAQDEVGIGEVNSLDVEALRPKRWDVAGDCEDRAEECQTAQDDLAHCPSFLYPSMGFRFGAMQVFSLLPGIMTSPFPFRFRLIRIYRFSLLDGILSPLTPDDLPWFQDCILQKIYQPTMWDIKLSKEDMV